MFNGPPAYNTRGRSKTFRDERKLSELTWQHLKLAEAGLSANQLQDPTAVRKASADTVSSSKRKFDDLESSSSLSPASQLASPAAAIGAAANRVKSGQESSRSSSTSSLDEHQPHPAPSLPQYQTFGPDPSKFDDPTIYHIREVTDDMTEEEKCEIYGVKSFPKSDLSDLIAGKPADKDYSNAKPTNQVNANTFIQYVEPYLRPLTEEDMAWLKERVSLRRCLASRNGA